MAGSDVHAGAPMGTWKSPLWGGTQPHFRQWERRGCERLSTYSWTPAPVSHRLPDSQRGLQKKTRGRYLCFFSFFWNREVLTDSPTGLRCYTLGARQC